MDKLIKNIEHKTVLKIKDEVTYQKGQIVSKTLSQNEHHSLTLFAFDKGEEISTHESGGDAMIVALDGVGKITIEGEEFILNEGETIVIKKYCSGYYFIYCYCNAHGLRSLF